MPRPTKLTSVVQKNVTQALALGATYTLACAYAGISTSAFEAWMKRGETDEEDSIYTAFATAVRAAEGMAAVGWLAKIEQAANDGSWQAAAWKLERRYPAEYGRKSIEHVTKDGEAMTGPQVVIYLPEKDSVPDS